MPTFGSGGERIDDGSCCGRGGPPIGAAGQAAQASTSKAGPKALFHSSSQDRRRCSVRTLPNRRRVLQSPLSLLRETQKSLSVAASLRNLLCSIPSILHPKRGSVANPYRLLRASRA